jgi:hypothetical protein
MLKFMRLHSGRIIQRCGPLAWLAALLVTHVAPAATPVSVQLVLAVDVSGSVSEDRFELQRQGYVAAFRSADVQQAIRSTVTGSIAVAMVQWTGPALHVVAVDWSLVADAASAERLAAAIEQAPRALFGGGTSISGAIDYAREMLVQSPYSGQRLIIDVSGDGVNNRGRPAEYARDAAVQAGVVINGLPILTLEPDLDTYYRQSVIGGPGAFVIAVKSYEEFAVAVRSKLVTEIATYRQLHKLQMSQTCGVSSPVSTMSSQPLLIDIPIVKDYVIDALSNSILGLSW